MAGKTTNLQLQKIDNTDYAGNFPTIYNNNLDLIDVLNNKQDKLIAGSGITIASDGKTISSSGKEYTAGDGIQIVNNKISIKSYRKQGLAFFEVGPNAPIFRGSASSADVDDTPILGYNYKKTNQKSYTTYYPYIAKAEITYDNTSTISMYKYNGFYVSDYHLDFTSIVGNYSGTLNIKYIPVVYTTNVNTDGFILRPINNVIPTTSYTLTNGIGNLTYSYDRILLYTYGYGNPGTDYKYGIVITHLDFDL